MATQEAFALANAFIELNMLSRKWAIACWRRTPNRWK